jgi:hypothetical protein
MSARLLPGDLPGWPYRMKLKDAAKFTGDSRSGFLTQVKSGALPPGHKIDGSRYWYQDELIDALDRIRQAGAPSKGESIRERIKHARGLETR